MFRRLLICLYVLLAALYPVSALQQQTIEYSDEHHQQIEALVQSYIKSQGFRGAVLVAQQGKVLHHGAYGLANAEKSIKNTTDTAFLIGSLTKSFTAVTVLQLVDQGKLDLHQPISRYIPALKPALSQQLTLHQLLKHQSGLPSHLERLTNFENRQISSDDIIRIINTADLAFEPGAQYRYSNLNYHLAAIAIENVTGKTYAAVLSELTFKPLQMTGSGNEDFNFRAPHRANGYRKVHGTIKPRENNMSYALGSGDIYSTTNDLLEWTRALKKPGYLSPNSLRLLFKGESAELGYYGYGFRIQPYQRTAKANEHGKLARHGGSMNGFLANLHYYQEDDLTVIVLANIRNFPIRDMTFEIKEIALGAKSLKRSRKPVE